MSYWKKNARKIILFAVLLLLSPFLIMLPALGLALAYTHRGIWDLRMIGGILLIVIGLSVMVYRVWNTSWLIIGLQLALTGPPILGMGLLIITGNPLYLLGGIALMYGVQAWINRRNRR